MLVSRQFLFKKSKSDINQIRVGRKDHNTKITIQKTEGNTKNNRESRTKFNENKTIFLSFRGNCLENLARKLKILEVVLEVIEQYAQ